MFRSNLEISQYYEIFIYFSQYFSRNPLKMFRKTLFGKHCIKPSEMDLQNRLCETKLSIKVTKALKGSKT